MQSTFFKRTLLTASICTSLLACSASSQAENTPVKLESEAAKFSYAMGMDIGTSLQRLNLEWDEKALIEGLITSLKAGDMRLTAEQAEAAKKVVFERLKKEAQEKQAAASSDNLKEGAKYMVENGKKEGVTTTDSGLQYEVITMGDGPKPKATDKVKVHYKGTLLNGAEFDSSYSRGEPISFPLNQVIPGWTEGVQLMPVGSKFRFVIPSKLAYGEQGAGPVIGPNSTLVFEVELLDIEK
ncbi:MAG: FKBP-type peptidyl-prolyl cis-trans isomerase [Zetaproteobacteria bacterium]|nr:FKBP-type peptidyl-prolyl cis-trans isomerase [Zetaproteobacteria bacterium]